MTVNSVATVENSCFPQINISTTSTPASCHGAQLVSVCRAEGQYSAWSHHPFSGFAVSEAVAVSCALALGFLPVLYACYRIWMRRRRSEHDTKDLNAWPIIGSQLQAVRNYERLLDWITGYFHDDRRTVKMSFLFRRSYLTVDPANVEHILKTNFRNYPKGEESHLRLFDLLGNGILNTDGSMWKLHRKLGSLEFSIKKLRKLSATVYKSNALKLLQVLANSKQGVDVQELLLDMTFHSICEVAFGSDIMEASICWDPSIASALDNAQEMITRRYVFPWWRLQRRLNMGSEGILREHITRFNKFLTLVIKLKLSRLQEAEVKQLHDGGRLRTMAPGMNIENEEGAAEDLLSRFISYAQKMKASHAAKVKKRNDNVDDEAMLEEVRQAMMSFVMAGRDTTASTLSWFLYCICVNPRVQEKVFQELVKLEEVNHLYSSNDANEYNKEDEDSARALHMKAFAEKVLSYDALQSSSSPYLHAALAETLRLYPAVPRDGKVALCDDVLPDGTRLKAGDQVAYIPYAMGRMPFLWGHDALVYKPERWLSKDGTFQPQSPFKLTAFQAGPRMCLGKDAAYLQMKITAAMLLRFFRFELAPDHPVQYRMMMVMTMKYGLRVHITPR